jgi:hypothetical protein
MCAEKVGLSFRFLRPPGRVFCILFDGESAWSAFEKSRSVKVQEKVVRPVRGKKF